MLFPEGYLLGIEKVGISNWSGREVVDMDAALTVIMFCWILAWFWFMAAHGVISKIHKD